MGIQAELLFQATDEQDGHGWSRLVASADFSAQTPCPERLAHPPGLICEPFLAGKRGPDDFWGLAVLEMAPDSVLEAAAKVI